MKIQIGEVYMDRVTQEKTIYPNKAVKYLAPCLKVHGQEFTERFNNVFKVAVGVGDIVVDNCGLKYEKHLFVMFNSAIATDYFMDFMRWIKDQPMYEDDYVYGNPNKSTFHMVVIKFPEGHWNVLDLFYEGKYSQMYNQETIDELFQNHPNTVKVFIKDHEYKIKFISKVNRRFGTTVTVDEWSGEIDFPPTNKTDKFNHHLKQ